MLPVALRVEDKTVLVIGAGQVAERRIATLLQHGADVRVVAPVVREQIEQWASRGEIRLECRSYQPSDIEEAWLVFAHTDSKELNQTIAQDCEKRKIWCLHGGASKESDIWMMAHERIDEEVTVAVSASANPKRAKAVLAEVVGRARPVR